jgi:hypothetical protein
LGDEYKLVNTNESRMETPPPNTIYIVADPYALTQGTWYGSDYVFVVFFSSALLICIMISIGEAWSNKQVREQSRTYDEEAPRRQINWS